MWCGRSAEERFLFAVGAEWILVSMGKIVSEMLVPLDMEAFRLDLLAEWEIWDMESLGVKGSTARLDAPSVSFSVGVSSVYP